MAPNQSKLVHSLILFLGFCSGWKTKTGALVEAPPSYYRGELSDCPGGSRCSSKHNQFKSHTNVTPHQGRSLILSGSDPNAHQSLSTAARGVFISNHLGKLPLLRIVIPLTCRLCHMQVQLFKMKHIDWFLLRFHLFIKDNGLRDAERGKMKGRGYFLVAKGFKGVIFRGRRQEF